MSMNKNTVMIQGKIERLLAVKKIIMRNKISCQDDLLSHLSNEGFNVTQATLSRDIKELKIAKMPDINGRYYYKLQEQEKSTIPNMQVTNAMTPMQIGIESLEFSGQIAVVKTEPGYASVTASLIDNLHAKEIMGTIAGDDTVLLIIREGAEKSNVVRSLMHIIPDINSRILINKI
jgi:transcriptional regulator of arginine metabolism